MNLPRLYGTTGSIYQVANGSECAMSARDEDLRVWLEQHRRLPKEFANPSTEAEELEASVAKTLKKTRWKARSGTVSHSVAEALDEVSPCNCLCGVRDIRFQC